ncbi:hypothetical protein P152DRAFT_222217 [Eremomyces bilateralis CBS 781.70]|uniref:Uncharacterized protein n=1 Tax=Eremomyces bilateralis CBS 781.70 TaxID=1392243 RepID=A0A6G1FRL2_9PEZI|nr:uncharacterized protein P152DRAFT_222217 [Eremomyces bilateralis CBS 781.70]KAF1808434.1 hypothetical protein P152DRAFT_222217 [Eremomyces bilateralis CBS 781.70]
MSFSRPRIYVLLQNHSATMACLTDSRDGESTKMTKCPNSRSTVHSRIQYANQHVHCTEKFNRYLLTRAAKFVPSRRSCDCTNREL